MCELRRSPQQPFKTQTLWRLPLGGKTSPKFDAIYNAHELCLFLHAKQTSLDQLHPTDQFNKPSFSFPRGQEEINK